MFTVAAKVIGVVITSSPGPMPCASSARCRPAVAEESAAAWRAADVCRELLLEALRPSGRW